MLKTRRQEAAAEESTLRSVRQTRKSTRDTPSTRSIPPQLQHAVPSCAQQCLSDYIDQGWSCPDENATCLCQHYSLQGYTLGELAYICLEDRCNHPTWSRAQTAYGMCSSYSRRATPTHKSLFAPPTTTLTSGASQTTSATTTPTGEHATNPASPRFSQTVTKSSTRSQSNTDATTMSSSTFLSVSATAAITQTPSTSLTGAQAAGISIAAMGALMLAGALVYLILYIRRRRVRCKDDKKSYDFVDEAPPRFSPFNYGYADPRGPLGGFEKRRAELAEDKHMTRRPGNDKHMTRWPGDEKHMTQWPVDDKHMTLWPALQMPYDDYAAESHDKSVSITPPENPQSDGGSRYIQWQMMNRPAANKPLPVHARGWPKSSAPSAYTTETLFEEDRPPIPTIPVVPARKPLPQVSIPGTAIHYPPPPRIDSTEQRFTPKVPSPPTRGAQPALSLAIPAQATRPPLPPKASLLPLPPPPPRNVTTTFTPLRPVSAASADHRDSNGSVLDYYASPHAGYETSPDIDLPTPVQVDARRRRGVTRPTPGVRPAFVPRPTRMNSVGSDTSFESVGEDEPTPPDEQEKQLSPVEESPFAGVRYPKIPRSSNQAVPRSPMPPPSPKPKALPAQSQNLPMLPSDGPGALSSLPQSKGGNRPPPPVTPERKDTGSSTLSGTTLAAKRRGDNAAHDLERRFFVADSAHSRVDSHANSQASKSEPNSGKSAQDRNTQAKDSPLKGYGRVTSGGRVRPGNGQTALGLDMKHSSENTQPKPLKYPGLPANPKPTAQVYRNSPHWEPKLTPSRRGEDLYLSVGVATPQTDRFAPT